MEAKARDQAVAQQNQERIDKNELRFNTTHVFNRNELLAILKHYAANMNK